MICRRPLFYALTSALCLASFSHAQAETLRDAVEAALKSHPGIEIANAQKDAAHEDERAQFSNLFPEISTTATGGRMYGDNSTTRGQRTSRNAAYSWLWEGNASITQPIFNGFETYNRLDAAEARETAAEFTLADAQQGLALRAAQSFLNVMRAQEAHNKTVSYQDRIKDYLSRIHGMVEGGAADASEEAQAKNIQAQLDNSVAEMEGQVKLALADYAEATGSMPSGELHATENPQGTLFGNVQEAIDYATAHHPLVLAAQKNLEAEDEEVSAEKGVLLPDLDGELSYLKRDQKEDIGGEVEDRRAVMRMSWNFSTGGGQLARIRKAKAEKSQALARTAQTQREIERDIRKAFAEYETAMKQKELNAKRAVVTKELFQTYEKQFEASKVRLLQLMQAENQVFTSELEQINSNYRVMMAEYTTLASSGRLLDALNIDDDGAEPLRRIKPVASAAPAVQTEVIEPVQEASAPQAAQPQPAIPASSIYPQEDYAQPAQGSSPSVKGE